MEREISSGWEAHALCVGVPLVMWRGIERARFAPNKMQTQFLCPVHM